MNANDNIVVCVKDVALGSEVIYSQDGQHCTLIAKDNIPACHKVAIKPIKKGADVLKYGERIGRSTCAIEVGQLVDHNNIYSVPRDYESELIEETDEEVPRTVKRTNGAVGSVPIAPLFYLLTGLRPLSWNRSWLLILFTTCSRQLPRP